MQKSAAGGLSPPFSITELVKLTHLGIPLEHITWARVSMTSDQWICIRHSGHINKKIPKGSTAITVLNPHNSLPQTWQASADGAKMNPEKPTIAVTAGCIFQLYNLESRKCLIKYRTHFPVHFWTWINSSEIVIVSDISVYHWNIEKDSEPPVRMFLRNSRLKCAQLVHYTSDQNMKWFALSGLFAEDGQVIGVTQVFSVDRNLHQMIEAHCVCFASHQFKGNTHPSCVLVAASRGSDKRGKLYVVELGPHLPGNLASTQHTETIEFTDLWGQFDFPTSIQVSHDTGLIYVTTKYGLLHLFDLETCSALCRLNVCTDIIFATAFNSEIEGMIVISRNGQVLSVDLKKDQLAKYVWEVSKRPHVAERLTQALKR